MIPDPTDEIRAIKRKLSEKFDNDIHRIAEDARRRQIESGRRVVTVPVPVIATSDTTNPAMDPSGGSGGSPATVDPAAAG
jgi:hypothetical protein